MTMSSRPRVLTEQDAGTMDTLLRRTDTAAAQAEARNTQLGQAIAAVPGQVAAAAAPGITAANQAAQIAQLAAVTLPKFRSTTTTNPAVPTQADLDANPDGIGGLRLTGDGQTQPLLWSPHMTSGAWVAVGVPSATGAQVQGVQLLAALATKYQSSTTDLPNSPSDEEAGAYAAAHPDAPNIPGSQQTADGGVQRLRFTGGAWVADGQASASAPQVNVVRASIGAVDVRRFSVLPNGADMTAALTAALNSGEHLTITQPGDYVLDNGANGPLQAYGLQRSLTMLPGTRLLIRDNTQRGVWLHSPHAIELSLNVEYQTPATARAENMHGIQIDDALDVLLTQVRSVGAPAIACMVYRGQRVIVGHAHVEGNMADGLHFYNVIDAHLGSLRGYNNGDDTLAFHGKPNDGDQGQGYGLTAGSIISRNAHASGIACIGSGQIIINQFLIQNTGVDGIRFDSGTDYGGQDPFGLGESNRVTLGRGRIIDAGRNPKSVTPGSDSHGIRVGAVKGGCRIGQVDIVNPKTHGLYARATESLSLGEITAEATGGMGYLLDSVGHVDHQGGVTARNTGNLGYRAVGCGLLTGEAPTIINAGANPVVQVDGGIINWTTSLGVTDTRTPSTGRAVTFTPTTTGKVAAVQGVFASDALVLSAGGVRVGRVNGLAAQDLSKPAFPSSGTGVTNTRDYDVIVYVFNGTDAAKNVKALFVNGTQAASGAGMVRLRPGDSIIVSYDGAADPDATGPGWLWQPL